MRARAWLGFVAVVSSWAAPSVGAAEPESPARAAADESFREGVQRFQSQDYVGAAALFERAWGLDHDERYLWNEALSELNANRYVDAFAHLELCARQPGVSESHRQQIVAATDFVRTHVLIVTVSAPLGAEVRLDGSLVGTSPLQDPVPLDPSSEHSISATLLPARVEEKIPAGKPGTLTITLAFAPRAPELPSAPASHSLGLRDDSQRPEPPRPQGIAPARAAIAAGALLASIASGVLAVVFERAGANENDRIPGLQAQIPPQANRPPNSACYQVVNSQCRELDGAIDTSRADHERAVGFGIASAVLAVAGLSAWFVWPARPGSASERALSIRPSVASGRVGVWLGAQF
jgi:hypothetical protein